MPFTKIYPIHAFDTQPSFCVVFNMSSVGINDTCNATDMLEHAHAQLVAALASQLPKPWQAYTRLSAHDAHACVAKTWQQCRLQLALRASSGSAVGHEIRQG